MRLKIGDKVYMKGHPNLIGIIRTIDIAYPRNICRVEWSGIPYTSLYYNEDLQLIPKKKLKLQLP